MGSLLYLILAFACISSTCSYYPVDCDQPVFVLETSDSSESTSQSASFQASNEPSSDSNAAKRNTDYNSSGGGGGNSNTQIITDDNVPATQNHNTNSISSNDNKQPSESQVIVIERHHPSSSSSSSSSSSTNAAAQQHHNTESNDHNNSQHKQQQHQTTAASTNDHGGAQHQAKPAAVQRENHNSNNSKEAATVRRLDETPASIQRSTNTRSATLAQTRAKSTTQSPYSTYDQPKTEERLLISITSEEDEYKPPKRQVIAQNGGFDEVEPTLPSQQQHQQQQSQHHKKRPAITISIQDNSNKQGGSGTPSVILKPSENGQSIIISTLDSSSIESSGNSNSNNNKYNPNKPAIAIVSSNGLNNNNNPPYREPTNDNIPIQVIQSGGNHHSSTHRPISLNNNNNNNEYNPPANKPIVSTLVDQPRPPVNIMTQRPPVVSSLDDEYATPPPARPSTSSPVHSRPPTNQPINDYSNNNNNNENIGSSSSRYPLNENNCGVNHETRIVGGDVADPNDFLWMAAIIKSRPTSDGEVKPFCGGSLITRRHILTAAHCLENLAPRDVLVRLGSYDFDDSTASSLSNDYAIDQFRKPAQYNKKTHVADIAIMRLKTPLQPSDNYKTVCMPQARRSYVGAYGTVTGYGSQSQTFRRAAPKLRQVTVPIWENRKCSAVYKKNLTESFLCAGFEEGGKDACQGDSGGPLMTEGPNQRTIVIGVVSHGIGCGAPGYPGVYTRTSTFLDWIEENTRE